MKYFNHPVFGTFKVTVQSSFCYGAQLDVPKVVFTASQWLNAMSCRHVNSWLAICLNKQHNILSKFLNVTVHRVWLTLSISAQGFDLLWSVPFFCSNVPRAFSVSAVIPLPPIRSVPHSSTQISNMVDIYNAMQGYWGRSHTNQKEKAVWRKSAVRLFYLLSFVLPLSIASF